MWDNKYSIAIPRGAFSVFSTVGKRFLFMLDDSLSQTNRR